MVIENIQQELRFEQTEYFDSNISYENVIFLDIDGVLTNDIEDRMQGSHHCINESNLNNLLHILENVDNVKIFLSSSWRYKRDVQKCNELVKYYFGIHMIDIVGRTPVVITPSDVEVLDIQKQILDDKRLVCSRGYEIKYVVDKIRPVRYVILDDWDNFLDEQRDFHVRTNSVTGLTRENAEEVISILNGREDNANYF